MTDDDTKFTGRRDRPDVLGASTYRISTGYGKVYVNIGLDDDGDPFEVFVVTGNSGGYTQAWCEALGKTASNALRAGCEPETVADDLMEIKTDHKQVDNGDLVHSIPDAVGIALQRCIEGKESEPVRNDANRVTDENEDDDDGPFQFEMGEEGNAP